MTRKPHKARSGRKRTLTYAGLKKKADKAFSEWVRQKDSFDGYGTCATCKTVYNRKLLQCGHFISRVHLSTRWDERNCAPQCYACNVLRRGNPGEFALYLTKKYGPNIIAELVEKKRETVKYTRSDLEDLIRKYS